MAYIYYLDNEGVEHEVTVFKEASKTERELEAKGYTVVCVEHPFGIY